MHSNNVYHRDIKPANMLLDKHYNLRLTDFGSVGMAYDESGRMFTKYGTMNVMAPEMHEKDGSYSGSSVDLFACGVSLLFFHTKLFPI